MSEQKEFFIPPGYGSTRVFESNLLLDYGHPPLVKHVYCDYLHELLDLYNKLHKCADVKIISFSEARNNLKTVLDHLVEDADYTIITRRDAEDAVVMSLEYFNSLLETVYLLKSPANAAHLERSIAQFREGEVLEHDLLSD